MTHHHFYDGRIHHDWNPGTPEALVVASGDTVEYELVMAGHGQVNENSTAADPDPDLDTLYHLAGPIRIEGATVAQTLRIDILELEPGDWGWTMLLPGLGLLPDDLTEKYVKSSTCGTGKPSTSAAA